MQQDALVDVAEPEGLADLLRAPTFDVAQLDHGALPLRQPIDRVADVRQRSEEHTSELQSRLHLVCRLLLEKKKKKTLHASACHQHLRTLHTRSPPSEHDRRP